MKQPLISVIIPVYNVEQYLTGCLDSVFNNTYRNLEIICVNDGSTDNSLEILKSQSDERLRIIDKKNSGVSFARNCGLEIASGEYIAFVDSDDKVSKYYFEKMISVADSEKCDIVICDFYKTRDPLYENNSDFSEVKAQACSIDGIFQNSAFKSYVWGKLYRKDFIGDSRFDCNLSFAEDVAFNLNLFCNKDGFTAYYTDCKMYYYLLRESSAVQSGNHSKTKITVDKVYRPNFDNYKYRKDLILEQICRTLLAARYLDMFNNDGELKEYYKENFRFVISKIDILDLKKRIYYKTMIKFPMIYRMIRIAKDRSMISWEKSQRHRDR